MPITPLKLAALIAMCIAFPVAESAAQGEKRQAGKYRSAIISWESIKNLPPPPQREKHVGQAGVFAGAYEQTMIVGGGANFPNGNPWEGGPKLWWDDIFVLQRSINERGTAVYTWEESSAKLPYPVAYGGSVGTDNGVLCIGGCDAQGCFDGCFLLTWNAESKAIDVTDYPKLPRPLAFMSCAKVGDIVYVAGGQETMRPGTPTKNFFALDLSKRDSGDGFKWEELPSWDGSPRILAPAAAQDGAFYLMSGRNPIPGKVAEILRDVHRFDPATKTWAKEADIIGANGQPTCIMAAPVVPYPKGRYIIVCGGADGVLMNMLEHNGAKTQSENAKEADAFAEFNRVLLEKHPGFSRDVLSYDTKEKTWTKIGNFPDLCPVTTPGVIWNDHIFIPSGEVSPGVRTPKVWRGVIENDL